MQAYLNDPAIKEQYLARVRAHRAADQLVQNYGYWSDGKGCAVGCTIHSGNHADYETLLGIPEVIARLEDKFFEGLPVEDAREWPEAFLAAIPVGADLSRVWHQFAAWMLSEEAGLLTFTDENCAAIETVEKLHRRASVGDYPAVNEWASACLSASSAASSAASWSVSASAWSAWSVSAAAAEAAAAAESSWSSARSAAAAAWQKMAAKLLELLAATTVTEAAP